MNAAVEISATFLAGRYHGEEWPPSPARLIQAIVAGVNTGRYRDRWEDAREALRWIETRPAPAMLAKHAHTGTAYRQAVPNNDLDTIGREWVAGRRADPAKIRTMKEARPRTIEGDGPHVRYVWPAEGADNAERIAAMLRPAVHCLHTLGWGVDMACADVQCVPSRSEENGWEAWNPSNVAVGMTVPAPGFLEDVQATYARFLRRASGAGVSADTRISVYRVQRYERADSAAPLWAAFGLACADRLPAAGWHACRNAAAWVRHACIEALRNEDFGEDLLQYVAGHTRDAEDESRRMSFVPIPSIGHPNTDGGIRRVLICEPASGTGEALRFLRIKLRGMELTDDSGRVRCTIVPLPDRRVLERYTGTGTVWRSVTPVVLHGHNAEGSKISLSKTEKLLLRAFAMGGIPAERIARMSFQPAPFWAGTGNAGQILVPQHLRRYPRFHVEVEFQNAVNGPVLAGLGRHYGIGAFAVR